MKIYLTPPRKYCSLTNEELRDYFAQNYPTLPMTLQGEGVYWSDLKRSVKFYLANFDQMQYLLRQVYYYMQDPKRCNSPRTHSPFSNRYGRTEMPRVKFTDKDSVFLNESGLYVDDKNKSIAVPFGYRWNKQTSAARDRLHKAGYLSIRATV